MGTFKRLTISIFCTCCLFFLFQISIIWYVGRNSNTEELWGALGMSLLFHISLYIYLLRNRKDILSSNKNILFHRLRLANQLTIYRISSTPTLCYLCIIVVNQQQFVALLILFTLASVLTDFLDGIISRTFHQTSLLGSRLDSMADYLFLISLTSTYWYLKLLPTYFITLIAIRYFFQALVSVFLRIKKKIYATGATKLGKTTMFCLMIFLWSRLLQFLPRTYESFSAVIGWSELLIAALIISSFIERIFLLFHDLRAHSSPAKMDLR